MLFGSVSMMAWLHAGWPFCQWVCQSLWVAGQLALGSGELQSENSLPLWSAHLTLRAQWLGYVGALFCYGSVTWVWIFMLRVCIVVLVLIMLIHAVKKAWLE